MGKNNFDFELGAPVKLSMSGEQGRVIGIHQALDHPVQYHVRYVAADGRQVEGWFWASEIMTAEPQDVPVNQDTADNSIWKNREPVTYPESKDRCLSARIEELEAFMRQMKDVHSAFDTVTFSRHPY